MRKLFIILFLSGITSLCSGQVLINLQLPPAGLISKNQLWQFSLINSSKITLDIQVEMVLTDLSNQQKVFTATSKVFRLAQGVKQVSMAEVMPVLYNATNAAYGVTSAPDGFLPIGRFTACYIVNSVKDYTEQIAEDCANIEVEPVSPPLLVLPSDNENISLRRPLFTWVAPAPYNLFNNLRYDWLLVEVRPTQTAADAIQQNVPILTQQNIGYNNFQYPSSAKELDTSKVYAWRITAKNNIIPVANSEVWTFTVKKDARDTVAKKYNSYLKLKREEDASYGIAGKALYFEYMNESNEPALNIKIYDITNASRKEVNLGKGYYPVRYGQNLMEVELGKHFSEGHIYLLEVTNSRNQKQFLKFQYRKGA